MSEQPPKRPATPPIPPAAKSAVVSAAEDSISPAAEKAKHKVQWCADCWQRADEDLCVGHNRVLSAGAAAAEARQQVARALWRLELVEAVREREEAAALRAEVDRSEGEGWCVEGGTIRIALAGEGLEAEEEEEEVCQALEGVELRMTKGDNWATAALVGCLSAELLDKLPDHMPGIPMALGTVFLVRSGPGCHEDLQVLLDDDEKPLRMDAKVLGRVTSSLEVLAECNGCEGDDHDCGSTKYGYDCYCKSGKASTTLSSVQVV